jgi:hypothetical protein
MQRIALPPLEQRLQRRYLSMVHSHMHSVPKLAAGIASLPGVASGFAATQGAWRFLHNERVKLSTLVEPLRQVARDRLANSNCRFAMLVHDWCKLSFVFGKSDEVQLTHATDIGYELTTALLVDAADGSPLAPMEMHLKTGRGVLSTRRPAPRNVSHLEQVLPTMNASPSWGLNRRLLHVIDREADSVDHYRRWDKSGHLYLVRADDRLVKWYGETRLLSEVRGTVKTRGKFRNFGMASHRGSAAHLWVAETEVVLDRPAKKNVKGKKFTLKGPPVTLRLVIVQLRNKSGKVLAEWFLLSNMPIDLATADKLAQCYYWRWRIESFFKLLKSHGQQIESWQQETGPAVARRLLIAAMACVVVWQLEADKSPKAMELKTLLVRLSGRQTKRKRPHTTPALLAGLWVLLSMLALLEQYDLNKLRKLAAQIPYLNTG